MFSSWQLSRKIIKRFRIAGIISAVLVFFWYLPYMLFQFELGRRGGADYLSGELGKSLGTEVHIGEVAMSISGDVKVHFLQVKDSLGENALSARTLVLDLSAKSIWKFLNDKSLDFDHIRLFRPEIRLREDSLGQLNISSILRHLQGDGVENKGDFQLSIFSILIREASCHYYREDSLVFALEDLDCKLDELELDKEEGRQLTVRDLSFTLGNGVRVKSFSTSVEQMQDSLRFKDLDLLFGDSQVNIPSLYFNLQRFGLAKLDKVDIAQINIALKDLAVFFPKLSVFKSERLQGKGLIQGKPKGVNINTLELSIDKLINLELNSGILNLDIWSKLVGFESSDIKFRIGEEFWERVGFLNLGQEKEQLRQDLSLLGACQWQGELSWRKGIRLKTKGLAQTDVGSLELDADGMFVDEELLNFATNIRARELNIEAFRQKEIDLQIPNLDLNLNLYRSQLEEPWELTSKLSIPQFRFRGKDYEAFQILGSGVERYKLAMTFDDKVVQAKTLLDFHYNKRTVEAIKLDYDLKNIALADWGVEDKSGRSYNLNGTLNLSKPSIKEGDVLLNIKELSWYTHAKEGKSLEDIQFALNQGANGTALIVQAPWIKGLIKSSSSLSLLPERIRSTFFRQIPIIAHWGKQALEQRAKTTALVDIKLDSLPSALNDLISLPLATQKPMSIKGAFEEGQDNFALMLKGEDFQLNQQNFQNIEVKLTEHTLLAKGDIYLNKMGELHGASIDLSQRNNDLALNLNFGRDKQGEENGTLNTNIQIASPDELPREALDLNMLIGIRPSNLRIHKQNWQLAPAEILLSKTGSYIKGLELSSKEKSLAIDGALSQNPSDSLHLKLERMSLLYILDAANVHFSLLDAELSGDLYAKMNDGVLYAFGDVKSQEFFVDGYDAGASNLHLDWDSKRNFLGINGYLGDYPKAYTKANGGINLAGHSGIDILFSAQKLNIGFVQAFTDGFLSKLAGQVIGDIRLFGVFRDGVTIAGEAEVANAEVGVKSLGTVYRFSDKLKFEPDKMIFSNIKLTDERGQTAIFDGAIKHQNFSNMDIRLDFKDLDRFKILKNNNVRILPVCGEAYCSGEASLKGSQGKLLLSLNAKSEAPSDLSVDINALNMVWKDQSLMRFVNLRDSIPQTQESELKKDKKHGQSLLDMHLNLDIDADTQLGIRIGNNRSDEIKARGEGKLQINVPFIGDQTIYGDFKLLSGDYTLRLENLTNKKFKVRSGSMLNFRGNPAHANIDIDAIYSLTANISDLDEGLAYGTRRTNMPVNCILNLRGELSSPKIGFGITLPKASGEVERRVKSLLSTEEAMTRQTLALISIGKFMPSAYSKTNGEGTNNWSALASTTISEQLSALIGDLSEKIQLGTNIKTSNEYFTDTEVELLFSGQLFDNRLIISGNVGYHDNPFLSNTYIGEFDLEYKLNKSGNLRLKGYNHYNNSYQYVRKGLTTQGFGLLFRKRFDKLSDLFMFKKKNKDTSQ